AQEIDSLKRRVKKLEKRQKSKTHRLKRLYKVGLSARVESYDEECLGEENASKQGRNIAAIDADKEITLVDETTKDQGRVESYDEECLGEENASKQGRNIAAIDADKEITLVDETTKDQGRFDDQEILIRSAAATTTTAATTLTISIDEITLAKALIEIKTSRPKAKGIVMQEPSETLTPTPIVSSQQPSKEEEQEQLTDDEKARLFMQLLKKRRKFFAAKRAEENRNRPPTKAQQRSLMCTYLKNMDGWKTRALKNKLFADIQDLFKKRIKDENESAELNKMLKNFGREDLEVLWRLVKTRFEKVQPVDHMDSFLMHNLKTMFEHHVEDNVWKNQQELVKVKNWKLYDSCGIHCVTMKNTLYYLLVEKMYPLTHHTLHQMFNDVKLQVDYECEMAYELLGLVRRQFREGYVVE
nr:hypothetical protein [Tanacetum cinerariifolium]